MKKIRSTGVFFIIFVVMAISILTMHYSFSYGLRKQPPSSEWSKEVLVSNGIQNEAAKPYPKIINIDADYVIAHQDGPSVKLVKTDNLGKKTLEKAFQQGTDFIKYINLLSDDKYIYLYVVKAKGTGREMSCIKLDKDLNIIEDRIMDDVDSAVQIGKDVLVTVYKNKIEVLNVTSNAKVYKEVSDAKLVSGTKLNDKYMVSYQESNKYFRYFL
jgi:hypothetical protein